MDKPLLRKVLHEIDQQSEDLFEAAVSLAGRHRPLSFSQANGLQNAFNCENNINSLITGYIQRQADKATTAEEERAFWKDLRKETDDLRKRAEDIQRKLGIAPENKKGRQEQRNDIHLMLARDYMQHLVAHTIYRSRVNGG